MVRCWFRSQRLVFATFAAVAFLVAPHASAQQQWITPTPEELHMTSIPEVPGAEAVVLNRDELDDDDNHMRQMYFRIKILTEAGIKLGDVELTYNKRTDLRGYTMGEIAGRTIQPDGTVVPFTGKPYDKLLHKDRENAYTARVFSLPAVHVGSILEYRYSMRWDDHTFYQPDWSLQTDLFLRKGHFHWKPTDKELVHTTAAGRKHLTDRLTWADSLPKGTEVKMVRLPTQRLDLSLDMTNVPPFGNEEYMPPIQSSRYHVFFYYTPYYSAQDYWKTEVKDWNSDMNHFTKVTDTVREAAAKAAAGATSDEDKARKLYAFTMTLENTTYTRNRSTEEEKLEIKSAEDVLKRGHGNADQVAMTSVALARAAGLKASVLAVADRRRLIFDLSWLDLGAQLTDTVAVVHYGGADHFVDPGVRYATFGQLEWDHTLVAGLRQDSTDTTKMFEMTPGGPYKESNTSRVADLKLDEDGHTTGTVTLTYIGNPALRWRHIALTNDEARLKTDLKKSIEGMLPSNDEVEVTKVEGLENGEVPLKVTATVNGSLGNAVGSRVMLPAELFEANASPVFPHTKRDLAVYFPYAEIHQDAVRYTIPAGFVFESVPATSTSRFRQSAAYSVTTTQTPNTVTVRRDLIMGELYFPLEDYAELRTFFSEFERKDHDSIVLKRAGASSPATQPAGQ